MIMSGEGPLSKILYRETDEDRMLPCCFLSMPSFDDKWCRKIDVVDTGFYRCFIFTGDYDTLFFFFFFAENWCNGCIYRV